MLSDQQGGFRRGFSIASSIVHLTNILFNNANNGLTSMVAFINLKKAFHMVDHSILLNKLALYGIRDGNLQWCVDYLSNPTQRAMVNDITSNNCPVLCGIPQGSVLRPLFFILYVNDVQNAVNGAHIQLYADDTVLVAQGNNSEDGVERLQPALNQYLSWCRAKKLSLNTSKTYAGWYEGQSQESEKHYCNNGRGETAACPYQQVYLGIILNNTLSFNSHVCKIGA